MSDTRLMSYAELADTLDLTAGSVRNLVRRKRWQRVQGNDGRARVHVPIEALPPDGTSDGGTDAPISGASDGPTSPPTPTPTHGGTSSATSVPTDPTPDGADDAPSPDPSPADVLRGELDAARAELADARETLVGVTARLEAERERTGELRERVGEAHADRDRWAAMADGLRIEAGELRAALEREGVKREEAERRAAQGVLARLFGRTG